jgi:hypothetical protein
MLVIFRETTLITLMLLAVDAALEGIVTWIRVIYVTIYGLRCRNRCLIFEASRLEQKHEKKKFVDRGNKKWFNQFSLLFTI